MPITPLEIRKQEFRKMLRGYDPHEVRSFLEMVSTELESLLRENAGLNEKVKEIIRTHKPQPLDNIAQKRVESILDSAMKQYPVN